MKQNSKVVKITAWIMQVLVSLIFLYAGSMKLFMPADRLAAMWPWTGAHPNLKVFTGILDLVTGLALVLPGVFRKWPGLTFYAAMGSVVLMVVASAFHIMRGEGDLIGINVVAATLCMFIAWARRSYSL